MHQGVTTTARLATITATERHQHRAKPWNHPKVQEQSHALNSQDQPKSLIQLAMLAPVEGLTRSHRVAGRTTTGADESTELKQ